MASRDSYFPFLGWKATITLQDIAVIWALPVEGNTVSLLYLRHMENIDEESTSNWVVISYISDAHTAHNAIRIIRNTLDRMQENEFIWTPYLHGLPELQSLPAYATRTPWNIRCPLINYSIVEMHHVERVLRQFGMIQDIPRTHSSVNDVYTRSIGVVVVGKIG
ncbi:UNVERIFIED_CONTAM: hypothetical protein Sradi_2334500 [Sesamum radiatum]|uniref:Aminotransferase-like plant mobile domain-containing protein n=1 Tax=Sesamum radiatum TaxID=300843 RepID=A0AAW2T5U3_SESRA